MRSIFSIITLFSLFGSLQAQEVPASFGRELPRSEIIPYPTQAEAAAGEPSSKYLTPLDDWTRREHIFTSPFTVPFAWANRQVLFHISAATGDYEVRVNGKTVAYNANGNDPADFNITKYVHEGRNTLEVAVSVPSRMKELESWKTATVAALGRTYVMSQPTMYIRDLFTHTRQSDSTVTAEVGIVVKSNALNSRTSRIHYELLTPSGEQAAFGHRDLTLDMRREDTVRFLTSIPSHLLWSAELPTQYTLRLKTQYEGRYAEYLEFKIGFRTLDYQNGRIAVNGKPTTLRAKEVAPYVSEQEIAALREQGYNTLKIKPGATIPALYDLCDALGLYVIAQAPIDSRLSGESRRVGCNPSNDPVWQSAYLERTQDNYHTSKRHPSVIGFSLAEKSSNGINLYESYLNMKRLEKERPVLYPDAGGEWNSDRLEIHCTPAGNL